MRNQVIRNLDDCSAFRQTLLARPPAVIHGTAFLLLGVLGAGFGWAGLTEADLVVRGGGRVRPLATPAQVFPTAPGEQLSASTGGRVRTVHFRPGGRVTKGDVLIRLATDRLDNEIAKQTRTIEAGEEELGKLARMAVLQGKQFEVARRKAQAEWEQAREEVRLAKERRASDVRMAERALADAQAELERMRRPAAAGAVSASEFTKASTEARQAREKWRKAQLPVDEGRVKVLEEAVTLTEKEHAVRAEELETRRALKQGEVDKAKVELASLELSRAQAFLRAPIDGVVTSGEVKPGDFLEPGKPVVEIAQQTGFRFELSVPSEEVGHLRVGMPARIKLDAYDYQKYGTVPGTITYISPDSGVPQGQEGAFYVVHIRLERDAVSRDGRVGTVKLGMQGQAEVVTGEESLLALLWKKVRRTISLG